MGTHRAPHRVSARAWAGRGALTVVAVATAVGTTGAGHALAQDRPSQDRLPQDSLVCGLLDTGSVGLLGSACDAQDRDRAEDRDVDARDGVEGMVDSDTDVTDSDVTDVEPASPAAGAPERPANGAAPADGSTSAPVRVIELGP